MNRLEQKSWTAVFGPRAQRRKTKGECRGNLAGELGDEEPPPAERGDGLWGGLEGCRPIDRLVARTGLPVLPQLMSSRREKKLGIAGQTV